LPPTPKVSPPEKTFSQGGYTPPLRPTKIEEAKDCDQSVLPDVETEPIQLPYVHIAVDESLSIEDLPQSASEYKWEGSSAPSVYQKEEPLSSPAYQNNDDTFWNDYPLHNDDENQILHICRLLYDRLDTMEATIQKLVKELEARDKQRDAEREEERKEREAEREEDRKRFNDMMDAMRLHTLESTMTDDERKKAEAKTKLEAMRKQKLAELEAELKAEYEKEGLDFAPQIPYGQGYRWNSEKVEYPKADTIGILNPLPIHKEWTGQAVDANGVWLSFSKWLTHLQAVMDQKESDVWKRACLDVATLTCLRGRAIDWWHSLLPEQQKILRYDTKLEHWDTLGKALHRNEQILRKEARDRVRQVGETLSEYAWKKFAMLQEAYGTERPASEIISDIKDGLSVTDQEIIQSDLHKKPSINRFMEELARLDRIRGPRYKAVTSQLANKGTTNPRDNRRPSGRDRQPLSESYDQRELKFRPNPMAPGKTSQWSYKFPNGRIIYLSSPCTKCGGKHFNFECKKETLKATSAARAAFMSPEEPWDEGQQSPYEESDNGENEMDIAYAAYMGIDSEPAAYVAAQPYPPQRQITAEPWDETIQKKEN
jgi:hypothetical protein